MTGIAFQIEDNPFLVAIVQYPGVGETADWVACAAKRTAKRVNGTKEDCFASMRAFVSVSVSI